MTPSHMVRGYGPFDLFLAKQRYKIAGRKIKSAKKSGRILDIGCGSYPLFLAGVDFSEKYGIDKMVQGCVDDSPKEQGIRLVDDDIENSQSLPFEDDFFDVVSMLAVFEHIEPEELVRIHREIYRILKPGGMYVMTTPACWTDWLLKFLAKVRLISDVEIKEHKDSYNFVKILSVLEKASFEKTAKIGIGNLFMAKKQNRLIYTKPKKNYHQKKLQIFSAGKISFLDL